MQEQRRKRHDATQEQETAQDVSQTDTEVAQDLLDEIDTLLEANAAEFVKAYVQKGGE